MAKKVIAVDPGAAGAIAILENNDQGQMILTLHKMPLDPAGQVDPKALWRILYDHLGAVALVHEDVHSIFGASAKTNFQFGRNSGISYAVLSLMRAPIEMVQPKKWQKVVHARLPAAFVSQAKQDKAKAKSLSLAAAQTIFPNESFLASKQSKVPHDGLVDAACIAYYCLQKV